MSCLARLLCCFKSKLREQYDELQKDDDITKDEQSQMVDWDLALTRGLGKRCEICADSTRRATHTAPCCHSACASCWESWTEGRCMFCNADLPQGGVIRAPISVLPSTAREMAGTTEPCDKAEETVNGALSELVRVKHELTLIKTELEEVLQHARDAADSGEIPSAVLQVDASSILQQMQKLQSMVSEHAGWDLCTEKLQEATHEVQSLSEACLEQSDSEIHMVQMRCQIMLGPRARSGSGVCKGQWKAIDVLRQEVFSELLPQALGAVTGLFSDEEVLRGICMMSSLQNKSDVRGAATEAGVVLLEEASRKYLEQLKTSFDDIAEHADAEHAGAECES